MVECDFCGEEFDSERKLHLHWDKKHEDELNSHQKEKVKKAEREAEEEEERKKRERKKKVFYGLAAVLGLGFAALIVPQLMPSGTSGTAGELDLSGEPMMGNENASVTVVEFGDYRCPYCARFEQATFPRIREEYIDTGQIKFYFVNFAFLGDGSQQAAVAGECVYQQDEEQFWRFHKAVYENQGPETQQWVTQDLLMDIARNTTQELDYGELEQCISSDETMPEVLEDRNVGQRNGIDSTPSILVNGERVRGNSFSDIQPVIERALSEQ